MTTPSGWLRTLQTVVVLIIGIGAIYLLEAWILPLAGVALLLLLMVTVVAFLTNFIGAITATVIAIGVFNFLFSEPRYTLHMTDADEIVTGLVFLLVSLVISHLTTSFRAQRERLRQTQLRSNILLSVSHDLRTPLASIMGNLSTLQSYSDKMSLTDRSELLQGALDESHRLHRYIENLLQATRLKQGTSEIKLFEYEIGALLGRVIKRFQPHQQIAFQLPDTELFIAMQTALLEQAFYNIVDNAFQFAGNDKPVAVRVTSETDKAVIDIVDQGPGVKKADRELIFDVFYSSRQRDSGAGGTGLGLPVSKGIIELHGGTINLIEVDRGCHIQVKLPLIDEANGS